MCEALKAPWYIVSALQVLDEDDDDDDDNNKLERLEEERPWEEQTRQTVWKMFEFPFTIR